MHSRGMGISKNENGKREQRRWRRGKLVIYDERNGVLGVEQRSIVVNPWLNP